MEEDDDIPFLVDLSQAESLNSSTPASIVTESYSAIPHTEKRENNKIIPISILTGFLGSGKTTLLTYLLTQNHGKRIAIIENELSIGLGIEQIIAKSGVSGQNLDGFFELNNGCICCSAKDNLLTTLEQLTLHSDKFDYILIEMTGVANPGPVITTFWLDEAIHTNLKLDGIVCVVDGYNIERYLETKETEYDVKMQICYADRILLNKCDLITTEHATLIESKIHDINALAEVKKTTYSTISPDWILNINGYATSLNEVEMRGLFDNIHNLNSNGSNMICTPCETIEKPIHAADVLKTNGMSFKGKFNKTALIRFLDGILYTGSFGSHDSTTEQANNDNNTTKEAHQIYRMKGLLHIAEDDCLYILQAVHDTFEIKPSDIKIGSAQDTTNGNNHIILIGKSLNLSNLQNQFEKCLS